MGVYIEELYSSFCLYICIVPPKSFLFELAAMFEWIKIRLCLFLTPFSFTVGTFLSISLLFLQLSIGIFWKKIKISIYLYLCIFLGNSYILVLGFSLYPKSSAFGITFSHWFQLNLMSFFMPCSQNTVRCIFISAITYGYLYMFA